jgi:hypothetical protein
MALQICGSGNKFRLKILGVDLQLFFRFVATSFVRKILVPVDRKMACFMKYLIVVCNYLSVGPTHCV